MELTQFIFLLLYIFAVFFGDLVCSNLLRICFVSNKNVHMTLILLLQGISVRLPATHAPVCIECKPKMFQVKNSSYALLFLTWVFLYSDLSTTSV